MRIPLIRFFGPSTTLIALLAGGWYMLTHAPLPVDLDAQSVARSLDRNNFDNNQLPRTGAIAQPPTFPVPPPRAKPNDRIVIGTFNIQNFGPTKESRSGVMSVLASIVQRFDVLAVQEISTLDPQVLQTLMAQVNSAGARYTGLVSKRLGGEGKEQYAFFWDTSRIQFVPQSNYEVLDPADLMPREPFVASFMVNVPPQQGLQPFSFTLITVHTSPKTAAMELNVLDDVYRSVRSYGDPEEDVILLGDLNAGPDKLQQLGQIPGLVSAVGIAPTNTKGDKQYDYILFDRMATAEFIPGRAGVLSYQREFGLDAESAKFVSDHCPVWAEFAIYERPASSVANLPGVRLQQ